MKFFFLLLILSLRPYASGTQSARTADEVKSANVVGSSESLRRVGGVSENLPGFVRADAAMPIIDNEEDGDDELETDVDEEVAGMKGVGGSEHDFLPPDFSPAK